MLTRMISAAPATRAMPLRTVTVGDGGEPALTEAPPGAADVAAGPGEARAADRLHSDLRALAITTPPIPATERPTMVILKPFLVIIPRFYSERPVRCGRRSTTVVGPLVPEDQRDCGTPISWCFRHPTAIDRCPVMETAWRLRYVLIGQPGGWSLSIPCMTHPSTTTVRMLLIANTAGGYADMAGPC